MGKNGKFEWPRALDAEQGVLGACVLEGDLVMPYCIQHGLREDCFFDVRHQAVWRSLHRLYETGRGIDAVTLVETLSELGDLETVGSVVALNQITGRVETTSRYEDHVQLVLQRYRHREMLKKNAALRDALETPGPWEAVEDSVRLLSTELGELTMTEEEVTAQQVGAMWMQHVEDRLAGKATIYGPNTIFWPWDKWNREWGALDPDQGENFFYAICAYTGEGKSSIARQVAAHNLERGKRVVCFQLEGTRRDLYDVMAGQLSGCPTKDLHLLAPEDRERFRAKARFIQGCLDRKQLLAYKDTDKIEEIRARCRQVRSQVGRIDLVVIDYLQLVESTMDFGTYREAHVSHVAKWHYRIGKELGCPVLGLVQLNREYRRDGNPELKWLRESAGIEQNADGICIIQWTSKDLLGHEIGIDRNPRPLKAHQVKRRSGERKQCWMNFDGPCRQFTCPGDIPDDKKGRPRKDAGTVTQLTGDGAKKVDEEEWP